MNEAQKKTLDMLVICSSAQIDKQGEIHLGNKTIRGSIHIAVKLTEASKSWYQERKMQEQN